MNGPIVTQMPTLCIPEKLNKQELIDQVIYLQKAINQQGQQLHEANCDRAQTAAIANHLAAQLHALMDSYAAGDQAAILLQLKELVESRTKQKAKVH